MCLVGIHATKVTMNQLKQSINLVVLVHIDILSLSMYITIAEIRPSSNFLLEHLRLLYVFPDGESSVNISESQEVFEIVTSAFVNKELLTVKFFYLNCFCLTVFHLIGSKYT